MSDLAKIRLQQARVHMQAGNTVKAAELLEQARALARADRATLVPILQELVQVYRVLGRRTQADLCASELSALSPAANATGPALPPMPARRRRRVLPILLGTTAVLLVVAVGVIAWLVASMRYDEVPAAALQPVEPSAVPVPAANPPMAVPPAPPPAIIVPVPAPVPSTAPAAPMNQPLVSVNPTAAPSPTAAGATLAEKDRAARIRDGVGLVVQVACYQGIVNGQSRQAELPLSTGTCFAVSPGGLMLTNRHVASLPAEGVPATLDELHLPTMVLQGTKTIVCFGGQTTNHYEASVLHLSSQYDAALLKVNRTFGRPFLLSLAAVTMGEQVFVCGYPGAVGIILAQANSLDIIRKFASEAATGTIPYSTWFDQGAYEPTLTAGIVSADRRQMAGASYIQIDAKVSAGNSGGPVFNRNNEVIGMVTLGGSTPEAQGYNFALSFPQVMDEIRPYLQSP